MSLLPSMVALANDITQSLGLQAQITHHIFTKASGSGKESFYSVKRDAIVEMKQRQIRTISGGMIMSRASITFLQPIKISIDDKLILPDGTTGPILATAGFVDDTQVAILTQVFLG